MILIVHQLRQSIMFLNALNFVSYYFVILIWYARKKKQNVVEKYI